MPDLLIELFSEEIPARMQGRAADDLKRLMTDGMVEAGLTYAHAQAFATPRRLALAVEGLSGRSPTLREERRGPKVGAPEKAIEGFCRGAGVSRDALETREEKKGAFYYATVVTEGRAAADIVAEVLERTIRQFPWPKSMRWGAGSLRWVRPLHRILCVLTDDAGEAAVVPVEVDGIEAGRVTEGHRFMGGGPFEVTGFEDYEAKLKRAKVLLRTEERAEVIANEAANLAFARGLEVVEDRGLLAEIAGLVEWPVVLMGQIEARFLDLPPEVLQTSMKEHQKFLSVRNPATGRIEGFVTVANVETADHGATILAGNQKVLAARLSDAAFFWENDLAVAKAGMGDWVEGLASVTFHNKLGSQKDRVERIAALAREIAPVVGADADLAEQAARVAKADLRSEMVGEFPELQGLMGRYYAEAAGMPAEAAAACQEHYSPLGPSDAVPSAPVSVAVALADKLDTLTGFWAIDEKPTGSKDPFALRRAALGVIRLVLENGIRLEFSRLLLHAATFAHIEFGPSKQRIERQKKTAFEFAAAKGIDPEEFWVDEAIKDYTEAMKKMRSVTWLPDAKPPPVYKIRAQDLLAFFHDRLKVHLRDEGIPHDIIDAVIAMPGNDDLTLLVKRAEALAAFRKTDDGENLVQGFKRANNLLRDEMQKAGFGDFEQFAKAIRVLEAEEEKDGVEYSFGADPKFAEHDAERALFDALKAAEATIAPAMKDEDFGAAMTAMAGLREPIDAFFEAVQVNTDNQVVRRNRLNLLGMIRKVCLQAADLTKLEG